MRILGIIAEYNPFHRGHLRHLSLAREAVRPDCTIVVQSGCVTQRGELALLSPYARASCALAAGADAVFALPVLWTLRDAEHYAMGGVHLLSRLGATHLAFGAETADLPLLRECAERLETQDDTFRSALRERLGEGMGYPGAVMRAMEACSPACGNLLRKPNNILAVCYLRAMIRLGVQMEPVVIERTGDYRTDPVDPEAPSASAIREAIARGDWGSAAAALTDRSRREIRSARLAGKIPEENRLDAVLIHTLRGMSVEALRALPDLSEGMENALFRAARMSGTREELLDAVSGKRYPRARVSRILACAVLDVSREDTERAPLPKRAVLLGLRKEERVTRLWRDRKELVTAAWEEDADLRAWRLWAECAGLPDTLPRSERVVSV